MKARIWKFGDNVDTDQIIASQYLLVADPSSMLPHVFESSREDFAEGFRAGDVIVAEKNFGCGSSREQAALVLKMMGASAIIAPSFARIFFRNAVNIGLPVITSAETGDMRDGEKIEIPGGLPDSGFSGNLEEIFAAGGLIEAINNGVYRAPAKSEGNAGSNHEGAKNDLPMTLTEKLLARASGRRHVSPGEIVTVGVDCLMTNDATTHVSIEIFRNRLKSPRVASPSRVVCVIDHNVPAESVATAHVQNMMRAFANEHGLALYDGEGVCHEVLALNHVKPGDIVIGADSHTPASGALGAFAAGVGSTDFVGALQTGGIWLRVPQTIRVELSGEFAPGSDGRDLMLQLISRIGAMGALYMAVEFGGDGAKNIPFDERMTLCAMAVEAGAKNALFAADNTAMDFLKAAGRFHDAGHVMEADAGAAYASVIRVDLGSLVPMVSRPHGVDLGEPAKQVEKESIKIDEAFIGSCSSGRISALRRAAKILEGKKVHPGVKLLVTPASRFIMLQALDEGLIGIFLESGAMIMNPNCSVCWGACQGVLGPGETLISTGTRNFRGRAGSKDSFVYLASAATVAASALAGYIAEPPGS